MLWRRDLPAEDLRASLIVPSAYERIEKEALLKQLTLLTLPIRFARSNL